MLRKNCCKRLGLLEFSEPSRHGKELRMSIGLATELQEFSLFVQAKLIAGQTDLSLEEALDLWREENRTEEEIEEDVRAIQVALDQMDAGERGMPADEFAKQLLERAKRITK